MKRPLLRVPSTLAVVLCGTTTVVVAAASCGGDDAAHDAGPVCNIYCFEARSDGGVPPPDGGCPLCADLTSGTPMCPAGCEPLG